VTNSDVRNVISNAASRGIELDEVEAFTFLGARELLQRDPDHCLARQVVANFTTYISTGKKPWSFAEFMLPDFEVAP
jgi:hypothetical protein